VAVSIYGHDNRSILDAMRSLNPDCRAIVSFDPASISEVDLHAMQLAGVRGVRINLKTKGESRTKEKLVAQLREYSARIQSRNWIIQLYLNLDQMPLIADCIPELDVRVVLDHMASPDPASSAASQSGYEELLDLLRKSAVWVKISGVYRFSELPDLDSFAKTLIKTGPHNVIWASDWPHTGDPVVATENGPISSYREVDDTEFVERYFAWCDHREEQIQRLFVDNPRRLWLDC